MTTATHLCRECGVMRPHHQCETGEAGCLHCDECSNMLYPDGPPADVGCPNCGGDVDANGRCQQSCEPFRAEADFWCRGCQEVTDHTHADYTGTGEPRFQCEQCGRWLEPCDDCGSEPCPRHDEAPRIRAAFAAAGFHVEDTGGGAQAFARTDGDKQTLVTLHDDARLPTRFDEAVFAGIYVADPEEPWCFDEQVDCDGYESVTSYLARWL